jgi:hypothetical protein
MMQKANISHGKPKVDMVERGDVPCVRRSRSLYKERFVRGMTMSMERKKKVMKKQRRSKKK